MVSPPSDFLLIERINQCPKLASLRSINETLKSLQSATKNEKENTQQVATATYVCNLIMCELDCIEDTTTKELKFSQEAKNVAKGIIWN